MAGLNDSLKEYDPKRVIITWSGVPLNAGISDGTFLRVARNRPLWTRVSGGDGEGARVRTNDHSGTVSVTMRNGSEIHQILAGLCLADMLTGAIVAPLLILDMSGRTLHAASRAYIMDYPEDTFGTTEENRTWVFECDGLFLFPGGSRDVGAQQTLVGFAGQDVTF